MENKEAMLNALRNKKARGLDLSIMIAGPHEGQNVGGGEPMNQDEEDKDQEKLGLAPAGSEQSEKDSGINESPEDQKLEEKTLAEHTLGGHDGMSGVLNKNAEHGDEAQDKQMIHDELMKQGILGKDSVAHRSMMSAEEKKPSPRNFKPYGKR